MIRTVVLVLIVASGAALVARPPVVVAGADASRLTWIATAQQFGPVGYRDPAGAISPDARLIAYSEGRFLRVRPIDGGPAVDLPPGPAQIRRLAWGADSQSIITDGELDGSWVRYDWRARTREPVRSPPLPPSRAFNDVAVSHGGWNSTSATFTTGACIETRDGRRRIAKPCGGNTVAIEPSSLVPHGPLAISPDAATIYFAAPNQGGTVDLWSVPAAGGAALQLTSFARDTYAPSVAADATVLFKVQSYRTVVAQAPAAGGPTEPLATFRSETPSWDPSGRLLGITYGTWRRVIDDAKYPDIAQEAGIIVVSTARPAGGVARVVDESDSEDQSLCWSPNGRWIAYHSHKEQSDDIWLRPADGSAPSRRISFLGRGAETGWPRWSPDGKWLLFDGADTTTRRSAIYVMGIDQESGAVTRAAQVVRVNGLDAEPSHAEWLGGSATLAVVAKEGPGRHVIFTLPRDGGAARVIHRFDSEHDAPGLGVSPDGGHLAFVAPATDGHFQIFRIAVTGGPPVQVTRDPSHKTQPAWSPDGRTIAMTVWSYEAQFWALKP
jgi:Tol biopolymer transport system component